MFLWRPDPCPAEVDVGTFFHLLGSSPKRTVVGTGKVLFFPCVVVPYLGSFYFPLYMFELFNNDDYRSVWGTIMSVRMHFQTSALERKRRE